MIGPTLAATFVEMIGVAAFMVMISAAVAGCAAAVAWKLPEQSPPRVQQRPLNPFTQFAFGADPRIFAFVVYGCVIWVVQSMSLSTLAFFIMDSLGLDDRAGLQMSSIALAAGAGALIIGQLVVIPALKASPRVLMAIGAVVTLVGSALMTVVPNYAGIVSAYILVSFAFGLARSGFTAGASIAVTPEEQGRVAGLTTATAGLGFIIGPVGGLFLYNQAGHLSPYMLGAVLSVIAAAIAWFHPRIKKAVEVVTLEPEPEP